VQTFKLEESEEVGASRDKSLPTLVLEERHPGKQLDMYLELLVESGTAKQFGRSVRQLTRNLEDGRYCIEQLITVRLAPLPPSLPSISLFLIGCGTTTLFLAHAISYLSLLFSSFFLLLSASSCTLHATGITNASAWQPANDVAAGKCIQSAAKAGAESGVAGILGT
jgi:hypothetical protein